jgi:hypothetical protein
MWGNAMEFCRSLREHKRFADRFSNIKFISSDYKELQTMSTGAGRKEEVEGRPKEAHEFRIDAELYPPGKEPQPPPAPAGTGPTPAEGGGAGSTPAPASGPTG